MTDEATAVTLARIEGKLDLLNAAIIRGESRGDDHEARLRALEAAPVWNEVRVAALERRPAGITPAKFLSTVVGFGSIAAAAASVVTLLSR